MAERTSFRHLLPIEADYTEGRVYGRIVPYNTPMLVADELPSGRLDVYHEGFRRGAFARQATTADPKNVLQRVKFVHEHKDNGSGYLGTLVGLEEREDGAYAEFAVMPSRREDALWLFEQGVREMSIEFDVLQRPGEPRVRADEVRWRTNARLTGVALLAQGAYGRVGAEVLAMRQQADLDADAEQEAEAARVAEEAAAKERAEREEREAEAERERRTREAMELAEELAASQAQLVAKYG